MAEDGSNSNGNATNTSGSNPNDNGGADDEVDEQERGSEEPSASVSVAESGGTTMDASSGAKSENSQSAKQQVQKKRNEYQKKDPSYTKNKLNEQLVNKAAHSQEPVVKPNALKLRAEKMAFDKRQKRIQNRLKNPSAQSRPQKTLDIVDKLENKQRQQAKKMEKESRTIRQQEMIAKAGPYGKLIAFFYGCKNYCLGHACIMLVTAVSVTLGVLGITGKI